MSAAAQLLDGSSLGLALVLREAQTAFFYGFWALSIISRAVQDDGQSLVT
jgi:hypothetical protein